MLQAALRLPELPRRIECFDISTIQGSETVASMVVCEDGRMKRGEYRKFQRPARAGPTTGDRFLDDFAAMEQVVRRRYAKVLEQRRAVPGSDRDRRRQGAAERGLCRARERRPVEPGRGRPGQEGRAGLHARQRWSRWRSTRMARRCACCSAFATRRTALRSRSIARRGRCATCGRSWTTCRASAPRRRKTLLTRFGSLAGVRRATREELTAVVGAKAADAIVEHFARV